MILRHSLRGSVDWNRSRPVVLYPFTVTPYAGVWIEMLRKRWDYGDSSVTPYAGVWIEIILHLSFFGNNKSLPTRECGLKFRILVIKGLRLPSLPTRECGLKSHRYVLLHALRSHSLRGSVDWNNEELLGIGEYDVTPYAGVWIEIYGQMEVIKFALSLPMRECGLKSFWTTVL